MTAPTIALFTRWPAPGRAKTRLIPAANAAIVALANRLDATPHDLQSVPGSRLIPALGPDDAARLHGRLVERTLAVVRASAIAFEVRSTGGSAEQFARWLGPDTRIVDQGDGDLGARLARVPAPMLLIGGDAPDLTAAHLTAAAAALARAPAVIGPAADGGYWLLGLKRPMPHLFTAMPWGTARVHDETVARLAADGIAPVILPTLHDCDRPEDLARWPELLS